MIFLCSLFLTPAEETCYGLAYRNEGVAWRQNLRDLRVYSVNTKFFAEILRCFADEFSTNRIKDCSLDMSAAAVLRGFKAMNCWSVTCGTDRRRVSQRADRHN